MELKKIEIRESHGAEKRIRLIGHVAYDDDYPEEEQWFDFPGEYKEYVTTSGNPWLAYLLPLAATLGEPLKIRGSVDRILLENAHELMFIWRRWYPDRQVVPIEVDSVQDGHQSSSLGAASFLSGGVDSFFTALRHTTQPDWPGRVDIDDFICVWGFDIPLSDPDAFLRMRSAMQMAASELGKGS